ncbi:MAG: SMP-30/gluconolactonase/LRE family protein [Rhizobiaceae bacterium]|nr:SMP-30/gluconolactonase/LRE family protein [Rhizobiaceae bacterium]MBL4696203.1 SMP-30/gluconolactonase/LRE family protein [Rhizobiaceae bacterium]
MTSLSFQIFSHQHEKAQLGESPCWDPERDDLWWVDVSGKRLLKTNISSGETEVWDMPEHIGFVVLTASDAPAVGMETGIFAFTPDTGAFEKLVQYDQAGCRFNDATVDQRGRLWASTMALDAQAGRAAIHLVTEDFGLETFVNELSIPNGLAVDLDRQRIFYSDSHPDIQRIWVKPIEEASPLAGQATLFANTKNLAGRPDGAALDQDGFYWIAGVDGSELYVFDLGGELHATIAVPFPAPTKICFSGNDKRLVVVTSKDIGEFGGYLAQASLPLEMTPGIVQPYWNIR